MAEGARLGNTFNLIRLISGIGMAVGNFLVLKIYEEYADFTGNTGRAVLIVLICAGFFTILSTFLYYCASLTHTCILKRLKCCGVDDYTDWMGWIADQPEILPNSCCKVPDTPGCFIVGSAMLDIYTDPCYSTLKDLLLTSVGIIAGVAIGIACIEISVTVYTRCLRKKDRDNIKEA